MLGVAPAVPSLAAGSPYGWAEGLAHCATSRPAVAHRANRQVLPEQPKDGPVPCGMLTGWSTVENRVEVTNTNTVIYNPAILPAIPGIGGAGHIPYPGRSAGMARTFNGGRTWDAVTPDVLPEVFVAPHSQVDSNLYVDHDTGRLFAYFMDFRGPGLCGDGGGGTIAFSDNDGTTWNGGQDMDHDCAENPTLLTGVPRTSDLGGYPNVVYLCGDNTSSGVGGTGTGGYSCSKSITGGRLWLGTTIGDQGFYSGVVKDTLNPYPQCGGSSSSAGAGVQPLPHGTLLVVVSCNSKTFLSKSEDEGATWKIANQIPHGGSLRADSVGNLYLLEKTTTASGPALLLSHSTTGGAKWSPELNMVAPGLAAVGTNFFVQGTHQAGEVGHVAVAYYGTRTGKTGSDGFITETRQALDPNPVFWSGQVNSTNRPLLYNTTGANIGITVLDFTGGALSPDGRSVWGSFLQDCGKNALTDRNCRRRWPQENPANNEDGFAGRLVWPANR